MGVEASKGASDPPPPETSSISMASEDADKTKKIAKNDEAIRNRVRSGFQYSMKVVLRGERSTGKTTLWHRLQGQGFVTEVSTPEIAIVLN